MSTEEKLPSADDADLRPNDTGDPPEESLEEELPRPTSPLTTEDKQPVDASNEPSASLEGDESRHEAFSPGGTPNKQNIPEASADLDVSDKEALNVTEETPADHNVTEETPADQNVTEETPADQNVTEETPADQNVTEETPADHNVTEETPADQNVTEETPADQNVTEETPADQNVTEETPADQNATEETPANQNATVETPTNEAPADPDIPNQDVHINQGIPDESHRPLSSAVPLEDILEEESDESDASDEVYVDREQLIEDVKESLLERERLSAVNAQLQHKIAEYLISRKKTEERTDPGRSVTDQEKRYTQCMAALDSLQVEMRHMQESFQLQDEELRYFREDKLAQVQQANAEFSEYKKEKALAAVHSRSGKKLSAQELDYYQSCEDKKEQEVIQVRLENIKLQNKIAKLEALIKQKEQLAEGLHMIDFEQLKINNVDLNEKIEERNEDILKLRRKVTSTVQVLTHVKEKLQFLQAENGEKRTKLKEMDSVVAKRRDHLTRLKQARDSLRMDNIRLRQKGGLVAHSALLRDFEERKDQNEGLVCRLDTLQQRHSELSLNCDGLKRKIEQAKAINSHHM